MTKPIACRPLPLMLRIPRSIALALLFVVGCCCFFGIGAIVLFWGDQ